MTDIRTTIYGEIDAERDRQDMKFGWIGAPTSVLSGDDEYAKLAVLGEEYGEVARDLLESTCAGITGTTPHLEEELVQVAAVAVAWLEAIREKRETQGIFYIAAATQRHAQMVAVSRRLQSSQWRYLNSTFDVDRVGTGATILKYETCRDRHDWYEMHRAIVRRRTLHGVRVITVHEADIR